MPQTVICKNENCRKPFVTAYMTKPPRFCSWNCSIEGHTVTRKCLSCDKVFTKPKSQAGPYCSKKCFYNHRLTMIPCAYCGELFHCPPSAQAKGEKHCSKECRDKGLQMPSGENHHGWQGKRRDAICEMCQTPFVSVLHPKTGWSRFCRRKCKDKAQRLLIEGKNNGRWTGGKSHEPYPIGFNNRLRKEIRERDGYVCQLCGVLESSLDRKLDVHHIDYNKDNLLPDNLLSLCRPCNSKVNHNREYWRGYFMSRQG